MNNLLESPLLQQDQKINVLNQYILPELTYLLKAAPINKIPKQHLDILNMTIRETAKSIIGLIVYNATNSFLYSFRIFKLLLCLSFN